MKEKIAEIMCHNCFIKNNCKENKQCYMITTSIPNIIAHLQSEGWRSGEEVELITDNHLFHRVLNLEKQLKEMLDPLSQIRMHRR
jgi:hypothetical protein